MPAKTEISLHSAESLRSVITEDARYTAKLVESADELEAVLRLRHAVFNVELGGAEDAGGIERDQYDDYCRHLVVIDRRTGEAVGTYRINTWETAGAIEKFYSYSEFGIEDLPETVLRTGVEVGRACVARQHRNTRVLFLLWRALAGFTETFRKRYIFGCCSIFTRDPLVGEKAFHQLARAGQFHPGIRIEPRRNALYLGPAELIENEPVKLPHLFELYLRLGAKVCGPPIIDADFGTIDFFVVFDRADIPSKYEKIYFTAAYQAG